MRKVFWGACILVLGAGTTAAGQGIAPEKRVYELTHALLSEIKLLGKADNGILLLESGPFDWQSEDLLARYGWPLQAAAEKQRLLAYFRPKDLSYMQRQVPQVLHFRYAQAKIRQPCVRVVSSDTLAALRKRLIRQSRFVVNDSLRRRYGAQEIWTISRILFSRNHLQALVSIGSSFDGISVCVYHKKRGSWKLQEVLEIVEF